MEIDNAKVFGIFPDGFRMSYHDLWDIGDPIDMEIHCVAWDALAKKHGGRPELYWNEKGIEA